MFEPSHRNPESKYTRFLRIFTLIMTLLYPALGIFLIFSSPEQVRLDENLKLILGIVLLVYGVIRFMRVYKQYFKPRRDRFSNEE